VLWRGFDAMHGLGSHICMVLCQSCRSENQMGQLLLGWDQSDLCGVL